MELRHEINVLDAIHAYHERIKICQDAEQRVDIQGDSLQYA